MGIISSDEYGHITELIRNRVIDSEKLDDDLKRKVEGRVEELLRGSFSDLLSEMNRLSIRDPNVFNQEKEVPKDSYENYVLYHFIKENIDLRLRLSSYPTRFK